MAVNEIVYFDSSEAGAPTLNNVAGSLINVLDACLINGYNSKSVTTLTVAGGVATATVSAHGYQAGAGRMLDLAGVTGGPTGFALLNGRKKVLSVATNTWTFDATGVSDGTATGTITSKKSPLGWIKQYSGTNKAMYKRSDVNASAMLLRIDDSGAAPAAATYARAVMVETATDVDTYTGGAPTVAQLAGPGQYWHKGANSTSAKNWVVVGDSRTVWVLTEDFSYSYANYSALQAQAFGDLVSYRAGDAYRAFMLGTIGASVSGLVPMSTLNSAPAGAAGVVSRLSSQIGSAAFIGMLFPLNGSLPGAGGPAYPSPVDNGTLICKSMLAVENSSTFGYPIRGEYPGISAPYGAVGSRLDRQVITNPVGLTGDLLGVSIQNSGSPGCLFLNLTGPWQ